ncbi:MAG: STAS domain-containing protein [Anaerolineae bacterium]|nr:STAS domain-containing protein [Anaerolineae bacterium]
MNIELQEHIVRTWVIRLSGRLDAFSVGRLREQQESLLEAGGKRFLVDLRGLEFLDSAGLAALVSLLKRARQLGGDVVLVAPTHEEARRILTLTRFDQVFRQVENPESYLNSL